LEGFYKKRCIKVSFCDSNILIEDSGWKTLYVNINIYP
jgi:hypothetical protein